MFHFLWIEDETFRKSWKSGARSKLSHDGEALNAPQSFKYQTFETSYFLLIMKTDGHIIRSKYHFGTGSVAVLQLKSNTFNVKRKKRSEQPRLTVHTRWGIVCGLWVKLTHVENVWDGSVIPALHPVIHIAKVSFWARLVLRLVPRLQLKNGRRRGSHSTFTLLQRQQTYQSCIMLTFCMINPQPVWGGGGEGVNPDSEISPKLKQIAK